MKFIVQIISGVFLVVLLLSTTTEMFHARTLPMNKEKEYVSGKESMLKELLISE